MTKIKLYGGPSDGLEIRINPADFMYIGSDGKDVNEGKSHFKSIYSEIEIAGYEKFNIDDKFKLDHECWIHKESSEKLKKKLGKYFGGELPEEPAI